MFKLSNENIVFVYLNFKKEIVMLDKAMEEFERLSSEKREAMKKFMGKDGGIPPELLGIINMLGKMGGEEGFNAEEMLRESLKNPFEEQYEKTRQILLNQLECRANVVKELQVAYEAIKDVEPDLVARYTEIIKEIGAQANFGRQ